MSEYQPSPGFEQPPPTPSRTGLWVAVIGAAACLILVIVVAAIVGLGWITYAGIQDANATATKQSQTDSATVTARAVNESATATVSAQIVVPPPGWTLTIDDQFTSNQNGWKAGSFEGTYSRLLLSVKNDLYQWQAKANPKGLVDWVVPSPLLYRRMDDFYLSADCRQVNNNVSNFYCGLLFHFSDNDNVYYFVVAKNQTMSFIAEKMDNEINVLPWTCTPSIRLGEMNRLAVLAEGTHYTFFINGQYVYEVDDNRLAGGTVGLAAALSGENDASFEFDNFQVYEP